MVSRNVSTLSVIGIVSALTIATAASAAPKGGEGKMTTNVPANYRQVVARYLKGKMGVRKVLKAEISRPGTWSRWDGVRPIACVRWQEQGLLMVETLSVGFMFQNGQVSEQFDPQPNNPAAGGAFAGLLLNAATCGKLTYIPFPEFKTK